LKCVIVALVEEPLLLGIDDLEKFNDFVRRIRVKYKKLTGATRILVLVVGD